MLTFVGFPFVVRTIQPVLQELQPRGMMQAAASLGIDRWKTFWGGGGGGGARNSPAFLTELATGVRPRRGRIRLGDFHRQRLAGRFANCAAANHHLHWA